MEAGSSTMNQSWRSIFRRFNHFMLLMWRLGLGPWVNFWPAGTGRVMVLVHTGRKTGIRRYTPVNFAHVGGDVYCAAGFGARADWYRNIQAHPEVEVWLPDGWWAGAAEDVTGTGGWVGRLRQVLINSGAVAPLFGVQPRAMSDEELLAACPDYRLVRIRPTEARTGPGGPGDLAWVWPTAVMVLLPLALGRKRRP